jgi:general secretion pathway protein D
MALDNEEAEIEVGQRVTIGNTTTATAGVATTAVNREEVKTALTITPSISPASNAVRMKIKQTVQDVTSVSDVNAPINTKALTTNIVVPNGDTAVLGGLTSERQSNTTTKIPLLGDIPVLGWLFRSKSSDVVKSHLMLFITPKIIRNPANGKELLKSQIDKRLKFIKKNMNGIDPYGEKIDEISKVNPISEGDGWDEETPQELKEYPAIETE